MTNKNFHIETFQEAGEVILPAFNIPYIAGKVIGIYTDLTKAHHLLKAFSAYKNIDIHLKEDALYERLTVKEHIKFFHKLYQSAEPVSSLVNSVGLNHVMNTKIRDLNESDARKLHFVKYYLSRYTSLVLDEPFQNINRQAKQVIINIIESFNKKMVIIISSNLEDLIDACDNIYRLDKNGMKLLDINNEQTQSDESTDTGDLRIDKIPTKKDDKIILFNPPEIDYIESVEGEVNVYVSGVSYPCSLTLTELEKRLVPLGFFRCHRSYIVNLQKVREIITWTRNSFSLSIDTADKVTVPLSRNKLPILKKIIGI